MQKNGIRSTVLVRVVATMHGFDFDEQTLSEFLLKRWNAINICLLTFVLLTCAVNRNS